MKEISSKELKNLLNKRNINLIDIRDNYSYQRGTIDNSINIPNMYLMIEPSKYLKPNEEYFLFCDSGNTSRTLCNFLVSKGYNVINVDGGYSSFIEDSL